MSAWNIGTRLRVRDWVRIIAILLACGALSASAKCIRETYEVSGHLSGRDGTPIFGARVTVAWGGATQGNGGTKSTRSDRDGSFIVYVPFDVQSGDGVPGDTCGHALTSATIDVSAPGYVQKHAPVKFAGRKAQVSLVLD